MHLISHKMKVLIIENQVIEFETLKGSLETIYEQENIEILPDPNSIEMSFKYFTDLFHIVLNKNYADVLPNRRTSEYQKTAWSKLVEYINTQNPDYIILDHKILTSPFSYDGIDLLEKFLLKSGDIKLKSNNFIFITKTPLSIEIKDKLCKIQDDFNLNYDIPWIQKNLQSLSSIASVDNDEDTTAQNRYYKEKLSDVIDLALNKEGTLKSILSYIAIEQGYRPNKNKLENLEDLKKKLNQTQQNISIEHLKEIHRVIYNSQSIPANAMEEINEILVQYQ